MSASKDPVGSAESIDTTDVEGDVADSEDEDTLQRDDIFHILQCRRRRLVLKYLQEHETPAKMTDITERIAALEHDTTVEALRSQERQRVYIALYQSHLPKLDEEGVIEYQQNRGIVERTDLTGAFDPYLDDEPSLREDDGDADERAATEPDDRTGDAPASNRQRSRSYAGAIGLALSFGVSVYANLPDTPVPEGTGIAMAVLTVLVLVATRAMAESGDAATGDR